MNDDSKRRPLETPFKRGDRVTIHTGEKGPQSLARVEGFKSEGRCMELSDGSLWRADGKRQWHFKGGFYKGPWVEREAPGDADHIAKRRTIGHLRKWAHDLSMDSPLSGPALRRILDLVEKETAAAEREGEAED
ncbi:hypothetical protein [Azospirillum sp.]|uniref:hypothetical protein n=1 Tax=Azospirillum sp. TaxID=34012 RepID=UPI003D71A09E